MLLELCLDILSRRTVFTVYRSLYYYPGCSLVCGFGDFHVNVAIAWVHTGIFKKRVRYVDQLKFTTTARLINRKRDRVLRPSQNSCYVNFLRAASRQRDMLSSVAVISGVWLEGSAAEMFPEIPWETSLKLPQDRLSRTKRSTPWRMTLLADIPSLMRTSCANHLQREHTKVSSFAFDGLVLLLRFCAGLFLTLLQHVASQNNSVTKMCVQIDFRALQPVNSPALFREPDFLGLIAFN